MGQQEVLDFLEKHKSNWFTSDELSALLKTSQGAVGRSLLKLRRIGYVRFDNNHPRNYRHKD